MAKYVVSVRFEALDTAPADWQERLTHIPGVAVLKAGLAGVLVEASEAGLAALKETVGRVCTIEPQMERHLLRR